MLDYIEDLADILTFAELEVRVKTVDMLQKDGMIDRRSAAPGRNL